MAFLSEVQQTAVLAVFGAVAVHLGRKLEDFFDPIPDETWALAWKSIGAPVPPPQPDLSVATLRFLRTQVSLVAPTSM